MLQAISLESQLVQNADGKSGMMVRVRTEEAAVCATRYKEVNRDVMQVSMEQNYERANLGYSKHKRKQKRKRLTVKKVDNCQLSDKSDSYVMESSNLVVDGLTDNHSEDTVQSTFWEGCTARRNDLHKTN